MKDRGNFQTRQRLFLEQKNSKLIEKMKEKRIGEKLDSKTGQELFRPKINDLGVRESQGWNIGNYLYQLGREGTEPVSTIDAKPKIN